ncbi:TetR/AcrR family transcriptional regulator [Streptomyces capillispiralis]|uniref:TetR family transcriptional regulator n=1 Tax=Streptomyces capillispiralis TaxID=68182 RepID=A0A561TQJ0_9ACTN|nr:TetR/AcrR family transcriptional regulator [Streptomyces capillispiralis]TWF89374.1 TetR family transcriptional regulator [Streptomyces capillispiralis]GHH93654.1 TetR family transcriptional regulator [Streptomyces capillispiralis]
MTAARGRTGRPPLTEERKAAVRLEIARAAVGLFIAQGVAATTGEQIGQAVGVSARTVWRYFPTKESCVRPLFSTGIDTVAAALRQWRPGRPLQEAFDHVWTADAGLPGLDIGALVRLTRTEPGLRAVWLRTHDEAEPAFARALAERAGLPADDVRPALWAAMLNAALRAAVEHHAHRTTGPGTTPEAARADLAATLRTALAVTAAGLT